MPDQRVPTYLHAILGRKVDHLVCRPVAEVALRRLQRIKLHLIFSGDAVEMLSERSGVLGIRGVDGRADRKMIGVVVFERRDLIAVVHHARFSAAAPASLCVPAAGTLVFTRAARARVVPAARWIPSTAGRGASRALRAAPRAPARPAPRTLV